MAGSPEAGDWRGPANRNACCMPRSRRVCERLTAPCHGRWLPCWHQHYPPRIVDLFALALTLVALVILASLAESIVGLVRAPGWTSNSRTVLSLVHVEDRRRQPLPFVGGERRGQRSQIDFAVESAEVRRGA